MMGTRSQKRLIFDRIDSLRDEIFHYMDLDTILGPKCGNCIKQLEQIEYETKTMDGFTEDNRQDIVEKLQAVNLEFNAIKHDNSLDESFEGFQPESTRMNPINLGTIPKRFHFSFDDTPLSHVAKVTPPQRNRTASLSEPVPTRQPDESVLPVPTILKPSLLGGNVGSRRGSTSQSQETTVRRTDRPEKSVVVQTPPSTNQQIENNKFLLDKVSDAIIKLTNDFSQLSLPREDIKVEEHSRAVAIFPAAERAEPVVEQLIAMDEQVEDQPVVTQVTHRNKNKPFDIYHDDPSYFETPKPCPNPPPNTPYTTRNRVPPITIPQIPPYVPRRRHVQSPNPVPPQNSNQIPSPSPFPNPPQITHQNPPSISFQNPTFSQNVHSPPPPLAQSYHQNPTYPLPPVNRSYPVQPVTTLVNQSRRDSYKRLPKIEIPIFSGESEKWISFWESFNCLVHSDPSLEDIIKFTYLRNSLQGIALDLIDGVTLESSNYEIAIDILHDHFHDDEKLRQRLINEVDSITPPIHTVKSLTTFQHKFYAFIRKFKNMTSYERSELYLKIKLSDCLPVETKREIYNFYRTSTLNLSQMMHGLKQVVSILERCQPMEIENPKSVSFSPTVNIRDVRVDVDKPSITQQNKGPKPSFLVNPSNPSRNRSQNFPKPSYQNSQNFPRSSYQNYQNFPRPSFRNPQNFPRFPFQNPNSSQFSPNYQNNPPNKSQTKPLMNATPTLAIQSANTRTVIEPSPSNSKPIRSCLFCQENHSTSYCEKYKTLKSRRDKLALDKKCFKCLGNYHVLRECPYEVCCFSCNDFGHVAPLCPLSFHDTAPITTVNNVETD